MRTTLAWTFACVSAAGAGVVVGRTWPVTPPALVQSSTPAQARLDVSVEGGGSLKMETPQGTTASVGETVVAGGTAYEGPGGAVRWWSEGWVVEIGLPEKVEVAVPAEEATNGGPFVASASGTKYHPPGCHFIERIKPENRITFSSRQEAEAAGYEPSSCFKE